MPIAAVPAYLGQNFSAASPGMRFGMYLPIWTNRHDQTSELDERRKAQSREGERLRQLIEREGVERTISLLCDEQYCREHKLKSLPRLWTKNEFAARKAWDEVVPLTSQDKDTMRALLQRQQELASLFSPAICWKIQAQCVAPFATGLGNEHPLENGFAFLWPYGLPYLPGSGVKGVIKRAAQELAAGMWPKHPAWQGLDQPLYGIEVGRGANKKRIGLSVLDVLFGREPPPGDPNAVRGALAFWDVIPQIAGDALMVEIMTPHQSHYYQDKREAKSGNSTSPHDSGQPNPIAFLTVPPGSGFCFHIVCDTAHLARLIAQRETAAPDLLAPADDGRPSWQHLVEEAFAHAFQWLGFGAKTTVGYGAMKPVGARAEASQTDTSADSAAAEPQAQAATPTELWQGARLKYNRANKSLMAEKENKSAIALPPNGEALLARLPAELRRKVEANQFVRANVHVCGMTLVSIEPLNN